MDKKQIQEKARNIGKFTQEVLDDLFGKRVLTFVYVLAAVFAASALFQVFTKYVYEDGFSTADALVATVVHTFTKIWGGILYGVLPAFGVFVVLYVIAKCIRNKNLRLKAEAEAVQKEEEQRRAAEEERIRAEQVARWREEDAARAAKEIEELGRLEWESDKMLMEMEINSPVGLVSDPNADDWSWRGQKQSGPQKFGVANIEIKRKEFRALFTPAFRGNKGKNIDYCSRIEAILEDKQEKFSTTELARLALALHETEGVVAEEMSFAKWLAKFCEALSVKPPLETSKNKYRKGPNIAELYKFESFSKAK